MNPSLEPPPAGDGPLAAPLGVLGGTFDPVHAGHLALAADAQRTLGLSGVVFVPAGQPWQKGAVTPAADRLRMLELAIAAQSGAGAQPGWRIDTRELHRPGPSYTVDTLGELRAQWGPAQPLVWVIGFDQLRHLPSWHRWQDLTGLAHLAYARRAGIRDDLPTELAGYLAQHRGTVDDLRRHAAGTVLEFAMQPVACSATRIRQDVAGGDSAAAGRYVQPAVLDYIRHHHLYMRLNGQ